MKINTDAIYTGDSTYYSDNFTLIVKYCKQYFYDNNLVQYTTVSELIAYKYIGDFYGLLDYLKVQKRFHRVLLFLNNLKSSADYKGEFTSILLFDISVLDQIANIMAVDQIN
jgi:hypothetical protein